jgi:CspA family cold shock protein
VGPPNWAPAATYVAGTDPDEADVSPNDAELQTELQTLTRELPVADVDVIEGEVDWFSPERGYGFIRPDDGDEAVFVRHSGILLDGFKSLTPGQRVRFVRTTDARGPRATDVHTVHAG